MNACIKSIGRRFGMLGGALALAALAAVMTATGLWAQSAGPDVYSVEEDWELVVGDADAFVNGPQVTCTISPLDMDTMYCAFDVNYRTQPDYQAGGLQLHTWDPVDPVEYVNSSHTAAMASSGETVTWTSRMTLNNGNIYFTVRNGQSQTWGTFGRSGHLTLDLPTTLSNLNGYSTDVSLNNSGVSFARNLVVSQKIVAVRWYGASGNLIREDTTPQVVHPQN